MDQLIESLERKLQRPLLAKSRTLPSIPQSPTVSRVHHSDLIGGSPPRRKNPPTTTSQSKACTLPPAGELWRLEDDMEGDDETEQSGCTEVRPRSQSPFSHFRARAAYLRKSVSADDHLDMGSNFGSGTAVEGKPGRGGKGKLKRKFPLGEMKACQKQKGKGGLENETAKRKKKGLKSVEEETWKSQTVGYAGLCGASESSLAASYLASQEIKYLPLPFTIHYVLNP
ncbi:uncharacterized protein LOC114451635 [Parambassis ranga]|uniref:Uncharacterized protein LOC114451635 n=1 Tax=Parambassis ranga TaxID=210632 RepID=A0A6P7KFS3_9TELE|nr:uncharacterized protein LOC114451635 [Parambassis ranga]